jgi:hypothetical protein
VDIKVDALEGWLHNTNYVIVADPRMASVEIALPGPKSLSAKAPVSKKPVSAKLLFEKSFLVSVSVTPIRAVQKKSFGI